MESTTSSASTPLRIYLAETPESSLRNPFEPEINSPQRNYLAERVLKRRLIEESQDKSFLHGLELKEHATKLLESVDLSSLQEAIEEPDQIKKSLLATIFVSFQLHYPNAFSLKLVKILYLQPMLQTRIGTVAYLLPILQRGKTSPMNSSILIELKNPLLHSFKVESEEFLFPWLCEAIGLLVDRLHQSSLGDWEELLQYVYNCISGDSKLNIKKGLILLTDSTVNREFWRIQGNFDLVFSLISELVYSMDQELKAVAYNSSISLISLSKDLQRTEVSNSLLPVLLNMIDQHGEEVVLVNRIGSLLDLVTPADGTILKGRHGEVFWCMIRVAEIEDASEELRSLAVKVIKELYTTTVIKNLSHEELKRVLVVAMNMLSRVVDDPLWYDVDYMYHLNVGMTDAFYRGNFLFNSLSLDGDESVFIPTAIETITIKYASDTDWQFRQAAMLAIGRIAERNIKGDMIQYFDQVARLVHKSLDDLDPHVLWATMKAIESLSEYKELLMHGQYHKKLLAKLVPIIRCNSCARVQLYAVIAIHSLVKNCGLDKISPFGESIIASLLALLKHEKQKLQVEAIDTLKSFAVLMPGTFHQNHYDTTLEGLKVIVFDKHNLPRFLLFAKCLECMVYLVREVGPDNFEEQEVVQVMESVISLEEKLSNAEYLTKCFILKALDQIFRCPRVSIDKYLDKLMPMLLGSAQVDLALTVDKLKDDYEKNLVETMIVWACNTLSYCAVRSSINFFPNIGKVTALFTRLLGCSSFQIRKASVIGLPNLLLSLKVGDKSILTKRGLTFFIVKSLIEVLKKETDRVLYTMVWSLLARCIQTSSSYFNDKLIKVIADEIEDTLRMIIKIEITKAQEVETLEGRCESLPTEDRLQGVVHLITTITDTFKDRFMLHVDDLLSKVVVFLADDNSDRLIAFAISIFNLILPLFPDKLPPYHDRYSLASCFALRRDYPCSELHATRAIGICAMYGGDQFKASANEGILGLYNVMGNKRLSISKLYEDRDVNILCDTAVAALGKIIEFHHDCIGPKMRNNNWLELLQLLFFHASEARQVIQDQDIGSVIQKWLNFLPLKHDFNEARYAHGLLSKLIQSSDEYLFGSNNENLAKIISIVKEILSGPDRLGTEEAINQMIDFIDQHG